MKVCFSLTNLELGGAQVFVLRLASELADRLQKPVFIYDHWPEHRQERLFYSVGAGVRIVSYSNNKTFHWITWKINAVLKMLRLADNYRHDLNKRRFERFLAKEAIDVVNSHMSFSDFLIARCTTPKPCHFIPSLHGEFELLLENKTTHAHYVGQIQRVACKASAVVYTAKKNLLPFSAITNIDLPPFRKINVGFNPNVFKIKRLRREDFGYAPDDFVVGMVSRGIPEKGWDTAIESMQKYNSSGTRPIKLLFIGDGKYLADLVARVADPNIQLIQFEKNFQDYFSYYALFDIMIFPSRFPGESVPNAVIESLYWNVPIVAHGYAEIPGMLNLSSAKPAGICVTYGNGRNVPDLSKTIATLVNDRSLLGTLRDNCKAAFSKFNMAQVVDEYIDLFTTVVRR